VIQKPRRNRFDLYRSSVWECELVSDGKTLLRGSMRRSVYTSPCNDRYLGGPLALQAQTAELAHPRHHRLVDSMW
jgi:hypothetical protein